MKQNDAPYVFSAFSEYPTCAAEAQTCNRVNFFADAEQPNLYARAFVVPQAYSNCALPSQSLHNGTFFNDLYMPYMTVNTVCGNCPRAESEVRRARPCPCKEEE